MNNKLRKLYGTIKFYPSFGWGLSYFNEIRRSGSKYRGRGLSIVRYFKKNDK